MIALREEQIKKMITEGKITKQEGERLLKALEKSRSGETDIAAARKVGKKQAKRRNLYLILGTCLSILAVTGIALGLYFALRGGETPEDLVKKADVAFAEGDYSASVESYEAAIEKDPQSVSAAELLRKGELTFAQGEYEWAIAYYGMALELDPDSSSGYNLLGMAYRFQYNQSGDPESKQKEIDAFRNSIELDPGNPVPLVNLGCTLYYQGEEQEAVEYLQRALEVYPDHPDRPEIEEMIRQAQSTLVRGEARS